MVEEEVVVGDEATESEEQQQRETEDRKLFILVKDWGNRVIGLTKKAQLLSISV